MSGRGKPTTMTPRAVLHNPRFMPILVRLLVVPRSKFAGWSLSLGQRQVRRRRNRRAVLKIDNKPRHRGPDDSAAIEVFKGEARSAESTRADGLHREPDLRAAWVTAERRRRSRACGGSAGAGETFPRARPDLGNDDRRDPPQGRLRPSPQHGQRESKFRLNMDSGGLPNQQIQQRMQDPLASLLHVVDVFKKGQINRQFILRYATMWPEPGT